MPAHVPASIFPVRPVRDSAGFGTLHHLASKGRDKTMRDAVSRVQKRSRDTWTVSADMTFYFVRLSL